MILTGASKIIRCPVLQKKKKKEKKNRMSFQRETGFIAI